jgi:SAM-dependent methyltransferase
VPAVGPAGARSEDEIARLHAHRVEKAVRWFAEAAPGTTPRLCPICGYRGMFSPVRNKPEIWCPGCDSRPRHRLLKLWFDREAAIAPGTRIVHFAAEPWVRAWCEARGAEYRTADINDRFELRLDLEALDLADASIDMLIANHVLEHVDDARALAEIARVLAPGGRAVLTVPMIEGWDETYEEEGLDEATRRLRYGDPDHRRFYGRDIRGRIRAAGLALSEYVAREPDVSTHALHRGERIFVAAKGLAPAATRGETDG